MLKLIRENVFTLQTRGRPTVNTIRSELPKASRDRSLKCTNWPSPIAGSTTVAMETDGSGDPCIQRSKRHKRKVLRHRLSSNLCSAEQRGPIYADVDANNTAINLFALRVGFVEPRRPTILRYLQLNWRFNAQFTYRKVLQSNNHKFKLSCEILNCTLFTAKIIPDSIYLFRSF